MFYKKFIIGLIAACSLWSGKAYAFDGQIGLGIARAVKIQSDGIWYQQGLPHELNLTSGYLFVGVGGLINPYLKWQVNFVNLGHISSDAYATYKDEYYNTVNHVCIQDCNKLARFIGNGQIYGIETLAQITWPPLEHVSFLIGPFFSYSKWSVQIPNFFEVANWPQNTTAQQAYPWGVMPGGLQLSRSGYRLGSVIGLSYDYKRYSIGLKYFWDQNNWPMYYSNGIYDGWPTLWKNQLALYASYTF